MATKNQRGLKAALKAANGISELARRLGVKRQAVQQWDEVPAERCKAVEKVTGVPRVVLRPDIFS